MSNITIEELIHRAQQGDSSAQCNLGYEYEVGKRIKQSFSEAVKWYRKSAEAGNATAQCNLGYMYESGRGVPKSDSEAVKWYQKSAQQGFRIAQCNLGYMYESGRGVQKSDSEAVKWYKKAAEQGYARAQCNLAYMYESGKGVERSFSQALIWYRKAAEQEHPRAQYNLGNMYESGRGVNQNTQEALKWYKKAAAQGYENAQSRIDKLKAESATERAKPEKSEKRIDRVKLEPHFMMIKNNEGEVMVVITTKLREPENPKILFDGKEAILFRDPTQKIKLVDISADIIPALKKVNTVLVSETDSGRITFNEDGSPQEYIDQTYDAPLQLVPELPKHQIEKTTSSKNIFIKCMLSVLWLITLLVIGMGAQTILAFIPQRTTYKATASTQEGKHFLENHNVKFQPHNLKKSFWTDFYRSKTGFYFYMEEIPETREEIRQIIKNDEAKRLQLKPTFNFWDLHGYQILGTILIALAIFIALNTDITTIKEFWMEVAKKAGED